MGIFSVKPTGFAPADTLKRTPQGRFVTWLTCSDRQPQKKQDSRNININFENNKKDFSVSQSVQKFDPDTGEYIYKNSELNKKPVQKKSIIQRIKDWWNKDKVNINNAENEALLKKVTIDEENQ